MFAGKGPSLSLFIDFLQAWDWTLCSQGKTTFSVAGRWSTFWIVETCSKISVPKPTDRSTSSFCSTKVSPGTLITSSQQQVGPGTLCTEPSVINYVFLWKKNKADSATQTVWDDETKIKEPRRQITARLLQSSSLLSVFTEIVWQQRLTFFE